MRPKNRGRTPPDRGVSVSVTGRIRTAALQLGWSRMFAVRRRWVPGRRLLSDALAKKSAPAAAPALVRKAPPPEAPQPWMAMSWGERP